MRRPTTTTAITSLPQAEAKPVAIAPTKTAIPAVPTASITTPPPPQPQPATTVP